MGADLRLPVHRRTVFRKIKPRTWVSVVVVIILLCVPLLVRWMLFQRFIAPEAPQQTIAVAPAPAWPAALRAVSAVSGWVIGERLTGEGSLALILSSKAADMHSPVVDGSGTLLGIVASSEQVLDGYVIEVRGLDYKGSSIPVSVFPDAAEKGKAGSFVATGDGSNVRLNFVSKALTSMLDTKPSGVVVSADQPVLTRSSVDFVWAGLSVGTIGDVRNTPDMLAPEVPVRTNGVFVSRSPVYILPAARP